MMMSSQARHRPTHMVVLPSAPSSVSLVGRGDRNSVFRAEWTAPPEHAQLILRVPLTAPPKSTIARPDSAASPSSDAELDAIGRIVRACGIPVVGDTRVIPLLPLPTAARGTVVEALNRTSPSNSAVVRDPLAVFCSSLVSVSDLAATVQAAAAHAVCAAPVVDAVFVGDAATALAQAVWACLGVAGVQPPPATADCAPGIPIVVASVLSDIALCPTKSLVDDSGLVMAKEARRFAVAASVDLKPKWGADAPAVRSVRIVPFTKNSGVRGALGSAPAATKEGQVLDEGADFGAGDGGAVLTTPMWDRPKFHYKLLSKLVKQRGHTVGAPLSSASASVSEAASLLFALYKPSDLFAAIAVSERSSQAAPSAAQPVILAMLENLRRLTDDTGDATNNLALTLRPASDGSSSRDMGSVTTFEPLALRVTAAALAAAAPLFSRLQSIQNHGLDESGAVLGENASTGTTDVTAVGHAVAPPWPPLFEAAVVAGLSKYHEKISLPYCGTPPLGSCSTSVYHSAVVLELAHVDTLPSSLGRETTTPTRTNAMMEWARVEQERAERRLWDAIVARDVSVRVEMRFFESSEPMVNSDSSSESAEVHLAPLYQDAVYEWRILVCGAVVGIAWLRLYDLDDKSLYRTVDQVAAADTNLWESVRRILKH